MTITTAHASLTDLVAAFSTAADTVAPTRIKIDSPEAKAVLAEVAAEAEAQGRTPKAPATPKAPKASKPAKAPKAEAEPVVEDPYTAWAALNPRPRVLLKGHVGQVTRVGKSHYTGTCGCGTWTTDYEGRNAFDVVWFQHMTHKMDLLAAGVTDPEPEVPNTPLAEVAEPEAPAAKASASLVTFLAYAEDAPNWSMNPWVSQGNIDATPAMRSHLRTLAKQGLITLAKIDGNAFIGFTEAGVALAAQHGLNVAQ